MPDDPMGDLGEDVSSSTPDETTSSDSGEGKEPSPRSAEARINELVAKTKQLEEELAKTKGEKTPMPPTFSEKQNGQITPEMQRVIEQLEILGVAFRKDLDSKVENVQNRIALDREHDRLERLYDGSDGKPKYDRNVIEPFMRDRGIYVAEPAYREMYKTELDDWLIKSIENRQRTKSFSERSGSAVSTTPESDAITGEKLTEMYKKDPVAFARYYEKNRDKIWTLLKEKGGRL